MASTPLSQSGVAARLREAAPGVLVECVEQTGSTNADLLARLPLLDSPVLRAAEMQTAGRGRAGRSWRATPGSSLAFSLAWPFFRRGLPGLAGLPLAVGVAVAEALSGFGLAAKLKWPNDLLLADAKLGGILIETGQVRCAGHTQCWAVIGVGINIVLAEEDSAAIGRGVAQAPQLQDQRSEVLAAIALSLARMLPRFDADGFAPFAGDWNALHAWHGRQVVLLDGGQVRQQGIARGVDALGALLLETAQGMVSVHAGDVSLRPADALAPSGA